MPNRAMILILKKTSAVGNLHVFIACQIDFAKKQFDSPLSWNNLLSETSLDDSYILTIFI